jgi:hypothetical protein
MGHRRGVNHGHEIEANLTLMINICTVYYLAYQGHANDR